MKYRMELRVYCVDQETGVTGAQVEGRRFVTDFSFFTMDLESDEEARNLVYRLGKEWESELL